MHALGSSRNANWWAYLAVHLSIRADWIGPRTRVRRLGATAARQTLEAKEAHLANKDVATLRLGYRDRLLNSLAPDWWVRVCTDLVCRGDIAERCGVPPPLRSLWCKKPALLPYWQPRQQGRAVLVRILTWMAMVTISSKLPRK